MPTIEENLETLAKNSTRIADAIEALVKLMANPITTTVNNTVVDTSGKAAAQIAAEAGKAAAGKEKDKTTAPKTEPAKQPDPPTPDPVVEPDPLDDPASETPAEKFTIDQVRAALKAYRDIEGAAAMMDVLKTHGGVEALSGLKEDKYAAVMAAVK